MSHLFLLLQRNQCLATIIIGICKMRAEARFDLAYAWSHRLFEAWVVNDWLKVDLVGDV